MNHSLIRTNLPAESITNDSPASNPCVRLVAQWMLTSGAIAGIVIGAFLAIVPAGFTLAQQPATSNQRSTEAAQQVAQRFLDVLMRRPRTGTALERVYGFHVQNGSLDSFIESLSVGEDSQDAGDKSDAGTKLMILGLVQSQRGKQALAVDAFAKAEQIRPDDYACSYYLGLNLQSIGRTEQAAQALERAIAKNPSRNEAIPIFTQLGRIYSRAGNHQKALHVWNRLEELFPNDARVGGQIAATLAEDGNTEEALRRYEQLATSARNDDQRIAFAVQAAEMRNRLGKSDECVAALEKIVSRLRPGSWLYRDVRTRIENTFLKSGNYDALAEYYQSKLSDAPEDLALRTRLGQVLITAQRLDEAADVLEEATRLAPDNSDVRLAYIDALIRKGQVSVAAHQFEALTESDPENPDYLFRWGQLMLEDKSLSLDKRKESAASIWNRLVKSRPDDAVILAQVADRLRGIQLNEDAIKLYEKAIDADPNAAQYREYLGEFLHKLDRKEQAIETWQSIAQEPRRSRESLVRLAEIFSQFKEPGRALETWNDAATFDLTFPQEIRYAEKLRESKRFDDALARLSIAESIAETPDEKEQLLSETIKTFQKAGTLAAEIERLQSETATATNLRRLAMMFSAAGQPADAAMAIQQAQKLEPDDPQIVLTAAEIADRRNEYQTAAEHFTTLVRIDPRYQTNYLERIAGLQMRLGQVDQALETCDQLVDANPASPNSYQFLARIAFQGQRDDRGFAALRQAMTVAPRDNGARKMLAGAFADRYRTDEAIELLWESLRMEKELDARLGTVAQLAKLYSRQNELDSLIARIKDFGQQDGDARATQLMIAGAYENAGDFYSARKSIDQLLANHPRDVALLEKMVQLADSDDEVTLAAEYQARVTALAGTPENRQRLIWLQLDADIIDVKQALSEQIKIFSDPGRVSAMIRSSLARSDIDAAITLCEEALKQDSKSMGNQTDAGADTSAGSIQ